MDLFLDERLRNRFTQKQLGEAIGKTQQYISAIEKGKVVPPFREADRLARYMGVPVERIFNYYVRLSKLPTFKDLMYLYNTGYDIGAYEVEEV
jgi:transcriptional regulator with XRE-family HTH domain